MSKAIKCSLAMAVLVTCLQGVASATVIGPWPAEAGYMWENRPLSGYSSGTVSVDTATNQLWTKSDGGSKTGWIPYGSFWGTAYSERLGLAKFLSGATDLKTVHAKVFDPASAAGWSVILRNSSGKWIDFGVRPFYANGKVIAMMYDGTTWSGNNYLASRYKSGQEYWTMDFTALPDGNVSVHLDWLNAATGGTGSFSWTTPSAFGAIEDVYLVAATSGSTYTTFKWTEFTPEPTALLLLSMGLWLALRRRTVA